MKPHKKLYLRNFIIPKIVKSVQSHDPDDSKLPIKNPHNELSGF